MTPARRHPSNPVPTGLPRPGHGRAVARPRCGPLPDCAGHLTDTTRTRRNLRCHPACRSAALDQGGLEGAAVITIHSDAIQSLIEILADTVELIVRLPRTNHPGQETNCR
jgi:hypothetical protein